MNDNSVVERPRTRIPSTDKEQHAVELISEVRDLFAQWTLEVPKKRKPWPESIKKRILELWAMGVGNHQIAQEAHVPVQTLYSWKQRLRKSGFVELPIARSPRRTGFQIQADQERHSSELQLSQLERSPTTLVAKLTVVVEDQLRFENVTEEFALRIAKELLKQ